MKKRFTSEELVGIQRQPEDSCPYLNNIIQNIQFMINDKDFNSYIDIIEKNLINANSVIDSIVEWSNEWDKKYKTIESSNNDNDFSNYAYSVKKQSLLLDRKQLSSDVLDLIHNDLRSEIMVSYLSDDYFFDDEEKEKQDLLISMKKESIFEKIEDIRECAKLNREFGNNIKKAYVNYSIENDLYDVYQPIEFLKENNNDVKSYNLGVINSEVAISQLINDNILSDIQGLILSKVTDENERKAQIKNALKENGFKKVAFYNSLDDFKKDKKYFNESVIEEPKLKNKNQFRI